MAILGWGIGLGLLMAVAFATATPAVLAGFASLAPLFRFLGDPYAMQTPEGYITFRYLGTIVPLLLSFWPILAGARLVRGEEERGTWHAGCAARHATATRSPAIREDRALLIVVLFALGAVAGEARIEHHVDVVRALLARLNLSLLAFFFGMLALLLSQFTTSRGAAAGGASGLLLLALLLDSTGREVSGSWVQYLSPFYYYNLNRPFIPSFHIGAQLVHLSVDQGRVMAASFSMLPPALITIGLVYALAGRLRYGAVLGILTAYLALSFLEETLEGAIQMATWVMSLSIFHLYGNPIFQGMNWGNFLGMTGMAIVLLVVSLVQFRYADIELG